MPVGLVDDDDFQLELDRLNRVSSNEESHVEFHPKIEPLPTRGRGQGDMNVPDSLRQIIGEEAVINGRQSALLLARDLGVSPSSVSAYAKGATSTTTYDKPSKSIISHINKSRQRAIKKAQITLNGALSAITQEKLDYADVKDLASVAKDMTAIIKNLEPDTKSDTSQQDSQPQFVIYAPQFRDERSFEQIVVKE